jgi:LexA-binding, inner membrane-associated putative hydrolase
VSPITHGLVSWLLGNSAGQRTTRRERVLITIGGLVPDVDGLGAVPDVVTRTFTDQPTSYFHQFHHGLHCLGFALLATALCAAVADKASRVRTALLFFVAFHVHLLCDVLGARGPATVEHPLGDQWPIPYLRPFSESVTLVWEHQWALNAWPNFVITGGCLLAVGVIAVRSGRSILEVVSTRADAAVVRTLRSRFRGSAAKPETE